MRTVELLYFAVFREARGKSAETITTHASSPQQLYTELRLDEVLPYDPHHLRVAINDEFSRWDAPIQDGDRIVFIAPVAGG